MEEGIHRLMNDLTRTRMTEIWEKARERNYDDLDDEAQRIAKIMLEHEEELYNQFEHPEFTYDPESDEAADYDPFLHITIHTAVEAQLEQNDPLEVVGFYNAMRQKRYSHHDCIHLIGQILTCLIYDMTENRKPFDLSTYRKLLEKYKSRDPQKLMELLESEPLLADAE